MSPPIERFVLHWGEMASKWGVNRSVGQIHALLYVSEYPMTAEDIANTLGMARSNVSNSLRELMSWDLVRRVHVMRDRRDFFEAETDLWQMMMLITQGRKEREIDPALDTLKLCMDDAAGDKKMSKVAMKRLKDMSDFVQTVTLWYEKMSKLPKWQLRALMKMGTAITKLIDKKDKK